MSFAERSPDVDPDRLGGIGWTKRTSGALSPRERRRLLAAIVRGQAGYLAGLVRLASGRVPAGAAKLSLADLRPPDSRFAQVAEEACREQTPALIGHGYRTWVYGSALAKLDRSELDPELFYISSLLHDYGLMAAVAGEDFTLRGARRARGCARDVGVSDVASERVEDAIAVHVTPGIEVERDGALGVYLQAGATLDLLGLRAGELPRALRRDAVYEYPRAGVAAEVTAAVAAEAEAVPRGRFAQLHRCGFNALVRVNPARPDRA